MVGIINLIHPPPWQGEGNSSMKFSTRTTYGLRAMIELGKNYGKKSLSLASISKKESISQKYLERIFANLKKAKLITSEKGATGGYKLSKNPKSVKIYEIIKALEGKIIPFHCLTEDGKIFCDAKCNCSATLVLKKVQLAINNTLKSMTLEDLL